MTLLLDEDRDRSSDSELSYDEFKDIMLED